MNEAYTYYLQLANDLLTLKREVCQTVYDPSESAYLQQAIMNLHSLCNQQIEDILAYADKHG